MIIIMPNNLTNAPQSLEIKLYRAVNTVNKQPNKEFNMSKEKAIPARRRSIEFPRLEVNSPSLFCTALNFSSSSCKFDCTLSAAILRSGTQYRRHVTDGSLGGGPLSAPYSCAQRITQNALGIIINKDGAQGGGRAK